MGNEKVRELAAIMFTDIVGYTALMQGDEEKAANVRRRHRQIFQQQHELHQGRIVQYYGDGTLSVFKSAISAVRCAMEIQLLLQQTDPVPLRIGLHMGDIVFDKTEVYGDGVNYASRIESLSVAGAILLSKSLNDELKNHRNISTASLGHFELKNIALPVEIFAITNQGILVPDPLQLIGKQKPVSNVLLTKLHISPPGDQTVHRAELFEKLTKGLKAKLTLISAPAGFGKTTLVSDWIVQEHIPAAWYSLDHSDNDASEFLSYVITAIEGIIPRFGENLIKLIQSPNKAGLQPLIRLLINKILAFGKHFILTLDDFHLINNHEVLDLFVYFIEHLPHNIHLVLLTRADPLLPLARLRSQHQLVELRSADLSFSPEQIQYLFNRKLKLKLTPTDLQSLTFKTEGWIAGLQLIGISLQGREDVSAFIEDFKGDNRYIMDYLIEEVLRVQTDEIKEFLLQTSVLEQLSGPLCNAVLERHDSQMILETLENNNMFIVSLDSDRRWYRYHHLFADLLKQRLSLERGAVTALHVKASEWFEQNQMYLPAINHLLQIQNYEKAIALLAVITKALWENGHHSSIMKYGEMLPDDVIKQNPEASREATEKRVRSLSGNGPTVLHLATHGLYIPLKPTQEQGDNSDESLMRSAIALAGVNKLWRLSTPQNPIDDGLLTAYEVADLDLHKTRLVILSACQSALGDLRGTEEVYGLQRGFRIAGVEKLIMSLWDVNDKYTEEFMLLFYKQLEAGLEADEAFRLAQRMLQKTQPDPTYWAAFIFVE